MENEIKLLKEKTISSLIPEKLRIYLEMLIVVLVLHQEGVLKYILFSIYVIYKMFKYNVRFCKKDFLIIMPHLVFGIFGVLLSLTSNYVFLAFKEFLFLIVPIFGAVVLFLSSNNKSGLYVDAIFEAIFTVFLVDGIKIFNITDLMESTYAFIFGIFLIYYAYKKKPLMFLVSCVAVVLSAKRIVWASSIICVFLLYIFTRKRISLKIEKKFDKFLTLLSFVVPIILLVYVFWIINGEISSFMYQHNINSMGRLTVWEYFSQYCSFSLTYVGKGLGYVQNILNELNNPFFARIHNDILLYYIQFGFLGFFVFFYLHIFVIIVLFKDKKLNYKSSITLLLFVLFELLCYCTDNISIYINFLFPLYFIMMHIINSRKVVKNENNNYNNFV